MATWLLVIPLALVMFAVLFGILLVAVRLLDRPGYRPDDSTLDAAQGDIANSANDPGP